MIILETNRLILRRLTPDDAAFIFDLLNDSLFLRFIGDKGVRNRVDARNYILNGPVDSYDRHGFGLYLTGLKEGATPIGICGLLQRESLEDVDVGYAFLPEYRGKGYAFESASAVLDYGKTKLGLKRIVAVTSPDNYDSISVLKKLGLTYQNMVKLSDDEPECTLFAVEFQHPEGKRPNYEL